MPLEWRGRRSWRMNRSCIGSSKAISCSPSRLMRPARADAPQVGSMLSGSTVSGSAPSRPSQDGPIGAVADAGERQRAVQPHRDLARGLRAGHRASSRARTRARRASGPWCASSKEPMPTLKMSKTLSDIAASTSIAAAQPPQQLAGRACPGARAGRGSSAAAHLHARGKLLAAAPCWPPFRHNIAPPRSPARAAAESRSPRTRTQPRRA